MNDWEYFQRERERATKLCAFFDYFFAFVWVMLLCGAAISVALKAAGK